MTQPIPTEWTITEGGVNVRVSAGRGDDQFTVFSDDYLVFVGRYDTYEEALGVAETLLADLREMSALQRALDEIRARWDERRRLAQAQATQT
jgi:hypothetical protein